nr:hypothetical protein [Tanacetum cinerariifolium]
MAREKVDNGFANVQAPETLPLGPFADGGNVMLELVDRTTNPERPPIDAPLSWKDDGAGAKPILRLTTVGGGVSGGTCCRSWRQRQKSLMRPSRSTSDDITTICDGITIADKEKSLEDSMA